MRRWEFLTETEAWEFAEKWKTAGIQTLVRAVADGWLVDFGERHPEIIRRLVSRVQSLKAALTACEQKLQHETSQRTNDEVYWRRRVAALETKVSEYEKRLGINDTPFSFFGGSETHGKGICPACGGDGGATGQCYKCDGTGWY